MAWLQGPYFSHHAQNVGHYYATMDGFPWTNFRTHIPEGYVWVYCGYSCVVDLYFRALYESGVLFVYHRERLSFLDRYIHAQALQVFVKLVHLALCLSLVFTKQDDVISEGQHRNLVSFINIYARGTILFDFF